MASDPTVLFRWRKWDGRDHWRYSAVPLGEDEVGRWYGSPIGSRFTRPGADYRAGRECVICWPFAGEWVARIFPSDDGGETQVYVDIAAELRWNSEESTLSGIDMDLDVVKTNDGRGLWIDDEDEFEEHRQTMGYPASAADAARAAASEVLELVRVGAEAFDGRADAWLDVLRAQLAPTNREISRAR